VSPFQPSGAEARWRVLYRMLVDIPVGGMLTYKQMAEALNLDHVRHRSALNVAMRRAAQELEQQNKRAVEVVRDEGHRVVDVTGQFRLAKAHGRKAGTQLALAYSKATNVDLANVDPEVRKGFEVLAQGFAQQMEINRRLISRQRRTERILDTVSVRADRTAEEVAEINRRLEELEKRVPE
jgi:hypothetical protein